MVTRKVAIAAGASFTSIYSTRAAHYVSVMADGDITPNLEVKRKDDSFTSTFTYKPTAIIEMFGDGKHGLVGLPASWQGNSLPALGTELFRIHASDNSAISVIVTEIEELG